MSGMGSPLNPYAAAYAQNMAASAWNSYSLATYQGLQRAGVTYGEFYYLFIYIYIYILGLVDIGIGCLLMQNYFSIHILFTIIKFKKLSTC